MKNTIHSQQKYLGLKDWLLKGSSRRGSFSAVAQEQRTVLILAVRPASRRMPSKVRVFIEHLEKTFALCSQFNPRPS